MHAHATTTVLTEYAYTAARVKSFQLIRRPEFQNSDREDIEQELLLYLISRADQFDPSRASVDTFVDRVVATGVGMLIRKHNRQKRRPSDAVEVQSLEMMVDQPDGPPVALAEAVSPDDLHRRTGGEARCLQTDFERSDSVEQVIATLPAECREICRRLMKSSRTETARSLGLSRRKFAEAMTVITDHFVKSDMAPPNFRQ